MKLRHYSLILPLAAVLAASALFAFRSGAAQAQEPVIVFQFPLEGDVLKEAPLVFQMCFKEPVDVRDLPRAGGEGDFEFLIKPPGQFGLGARIVFQPDGYGVAIYPGNPIGTHIDGVWTWTYRVRDADSLEPIEGVVTFTTNAATGKDILQPTPPACLAEGATQIATQPPGGTDEPATGTPATPPGDDDDLSVLELALITIGIAAAAAFVGVLAYFFRKRVGYEPHAPSDDAGDSGDDHH